MSVQSELVYASMNKLGLSFYSSEDKKKVKFTTGVNNGKLECLLHINDEKDFLLFLSFLPISVPVDKRAEVAEFITRANYGLKMGNFEMDFEDGEVRYRTMANTDEDCINEKIVIHLIHTNITTMDKYLKGIMAVVFGNTEPKKAIDDIENKQLPNPSLN